MDLFDPATYAAVRRPLLDAETLPPACYTSPEFYRREVSEIFMKCWNLIGRADYVKNPGDYFTVTVAGVPAVILRGRDGRIRAFINSCRHRGSRLLEGDGQCSAIRCPYHSWAYDLEGRLRGANGMEETHDFDRAAFGLIPVKLDVWAGFLFINFDPQCMSLADYLGDLDHYAESYDFASMVTVKRRNFELRANWKSYIENSLETFHLPTVHQRTIGSIKATWNNVDGTPGNFVINQTRSGESRAVLDGDAGFDPMPNLRGPARDGAQYILIYPCTVIGADLDCMWFKQMTPDGPDRMRNIAAFCFPKQTVERPDFEAIVLNYHKRFELVMSEDNAIAEKQFAGLNQPFGKPGRYSSREPLVHVIDNWILDRVVGRAPGAQQAAE
jgi:phenylpropionate dioxygenase-like ring-hydroxylating dioxygenase large terminal subunit